MDAFLTDYGVFYIECIFLADIFMDTRRNTHLMTLLDPKTHSLCSKFILTAIHIASVTTTRKKIAEKEGKKRWPAKINCDRDSYLRGTSNGLLLALTINISNCGPLRYIFIIPLVLFSVFVIIPVQKKKRSFKNHILSCIIMNIYFVHYLANLVAHKSRYCSWFSCSDIPPLLLRFKQPLHLITRIHVYSIRLPGLFKLMFWEVSLC